MQGRLHRVALLDDLNMFRDMTPEEERYMMSEQEQEDCENPCCAKDRQDYEDAQRLKVCAATGDPSPCVHTSFCAICRTAFSEASLSSPAGGGKTSYLGFALGVSERHPSVLWDLAIKEIRQGNCALTRSLMHTQAVLRRHDPVRKAEAQRAAVGRSAQTHVSSTSPLVMPHEDSDFGSDDDGDDPAVKQWQQARLAELMKERVVREQLQAQNHGRLNYVRVSQHPHLEPLGEPSRNPQHPRAHAATREHTQELL